MKSSSVLIFSLLLIFSTNGFSQSFDDVLKTIENNNKDIQAGSKYVESRM